jgi:hypothetical protein
VVSTNSINESRWHKTALNIRAKDVEMREEEEMGRKRKGY